MALTGRFWFRKTWRGKLVLVVEERKPRWFRRGSFKVFWRDANLMDFAEAELRPLVALERTHRLVHGTHSSADVHALDTGNRTEPSVLSRPKVAA